MDKERIFRAASELYHIPVDMVEKVYDVETLDYDEAEDIYGEELEDIQDAADQMGPNWYKEAKGKAENTIQIGGDDIQNMVYECVKKFLKESIDIDPDNKGKFTATKKRTGKSTEELTHSKNPLTRKRAIFAQNAKHWNHKK